MPTIRLKNVEKRYGPGAANAVTSLNLEIGHGEFMCLLGPSGCGKTTTLRMIAGLENLSDGEIALDDRKLDSVSAGIFVPPEKRGMGLVFQSYALWPHLTIERNTDFGLRLQKVPKAEREERVTKVMQALGIEQYRDRYPSQLSGGQQQRVALARMLAVNPGVLLLDEPLSNLDARLRLEMRAELKRLHEQFKTTIVFVTHDQWEAMTLATTIAVMKDGRLQQVGTPDDIYERPANRFVAEFVGNPPINIIEFGDQKAPMLTALRAFLQLRLTDLPALGSAGLRPESVHVGRAGSEIPADAFRVPATITAILPTGGSWIVELLVGEGKVFQVSHEAPGAAIGEAVTIWVRPEVFHLFDGEGARLASADRMLRGAAH